MDTLKPSPSRANKHNFYITFPDGTNSAMIVIGLIPIMIVYPFLQKYFSKGVMVGAVKG